MITGHFVYTGIPRFACHQYQAGKGCLHFANTEHFKGFFFSLFFNPCTAETCFLCFFVTL